MAIIPGDDVTHVQTGDGTSDGETTIEELAAKLATLIGGGDPINDLSLNGTNLIGTRESGAQVTVNLSSLMAGADGVLSGFSLSGTVLTATVNGAPDQSIDLAPILSGGGNTPLAGVSRVVIPLNPSARFFMTDVLGADPMPGSGVGFGTVLKMFLSTDGVSLDHLVGVGVNVRQRGNGSDPNRLYMRGSGVATTSAASASWGGLYKSRTGAFVTLEEDPSDFWNEVGTTGNTPTGAISGNLLQEGAFTDLIITIETSFFTSNAVWQPLQPSTFASGDIVIY